MKQITHIICIHEENPHAIVQTRNQYRFIVNTWAGTWANHLISTYVTDGNLTGPKYLVCKQPLLDDLPLQTRMKLWFMHDGVPHHFIDKVHTSSF